MNLSILVSRPQDRNYSNTAVRIYTFGTTNKLHAVNSKNYKSFHRSTNKRMFFLLYDKQFWIISVFYTLVMHPYDVSMYNWIEYGSISPYIKNIATYFFLKNINFYGNERPWKRNSFLELWVPRKYRSNTPSVSAVTPLAWTNN